MPSILSSPVRAAIFGGVLAALVLAIWVAVAGVDRIGFGSFMLRLLHIAAAMIWVGMIWFVNFIQLPALAASQDSERAALMKLVVPEVALTFRIAAAGTVLFGVLLLVTTGYLLDRWMFSSAVYIPPLRNLMLWAGTVVGLAMWAIVEMRIWPPLRIALGIVAAEPDARLGARQRVATWARVNLVLTFPVLAAMVAAAHLY